MDSKTRKFTFLHYTIDGYIEDFVSMMLQGRGTVDGRIDDL